MYAIGRMMQFIGLLVLPAAIFLELEHALSLGKMLTLAVSGVACFWIGRLLEGYSTPRES